MNVTARRAAAPATRRQPVGGADAGRSQRPGSGAYRQFSARGLALVRDRDEVYLRIRKTF